MPPPGRGEAEPLSIVREQNEPGLSSEASRHRHIGAGGGKPLPYSGDWRFGLVTVPELARIELEAAHRLKDNAPTTAPQRLSAVEA